MKWPLSLTIIRHGQSAYNILRDKKKTDPGYQEFVRRFKSAESVDEEMRRLALKLQKRFATNVSDYATPLTPEGVNQAYRTGELILEHVPQPNIILVSPYKRTRDTLQQMISAQSLLANTPTVVEDRIREQEHGLSLIYNDWRIFQTLHKEQRTLHQLQGPYWYQHPQGESVSMVRERIRSVLAMLVREYAGKHVWLVSHHLTLLSIRANLERLSPEQFIQIDYKEKPVNCGITLYKGDPDRGTDGKLILKNYNLKLY